jgi:hypothetical protein
MQLEVGRDYRLDAVTRRKLARDLAEAVASYCQNYLQCGE